MVRLMLCIFISVSLASELSLCWGRVSGVSCRVCPSEFRVAEVLTRGPKEHVHSVSFETEMIFHLE